MRSTWPSNIRLQQYLNILIFLLAREPTGVIVNPTVYPPLVVNYDFFTLTVELLNFGSQTLANNIPVGFPSSPIKCETIYIFVILAKYNENWTGWADCIMGPTWPNEDLSRRGVKLKSVQCPAWLEYRMGRTRLLKF